MGKVLIISGAGTGVDSGIKTFRTDTQSGKALWDDYDVEDVCNYHKFMSDRGCYLRTNEFYNKRRKELVTVFPNVFHKAVSELYHKYGSGKVMNITTNVDDLLERAGVAHSDILHVHGYLPEIKTKKESDDLPFEITDVGYSEVDVSRYTWVKPNVIFFGEAAPLYVDMYDQLDTLAEGDLVIVVGCSNQVINFNWELFPLLAKGVKMAVVNPNINYLEQREYEERGVSVWRCGSSKAFSDRHFLSFVENFLEK